MKEKITQLVAAVVLVGGMVWTPLGDFVNAAGGQAEIVALVVAAWTVVHGIAHYVATRNDGA